jgi:hypothetical protein
MDEFIKTTKQLFAKKWFLGSLILLIGIVLLTSNSRQPEPNTPKEIANSIENKQAADVEVKSQIVKLVEGKCRYFFEVHNKGAQSFGGTVSISLFNDHSKLAEDKFQAATPIEPNISKSVYLDANTCPVSVHGFAGIKKFQYSLEMNGIQVGFSEGLITEKLEDFTDM